MTAVDWCTSRSPAYAERLIGSIFAYYAGSRTHLSLDKLAVCTTDTNVAQSDKLSSNRSPLSRCRNRTLRGCARPLTHCDREPGHVWVLRSYAMLSGAKWTSVGTKAASSSGNGQRDEPSLSRKSLFRHQAVLYLSSLTVGNMLQSADDVPTFGQELAHLTAMA